MAEHVIRASERQSMCSGLAAQAVARSRFRVSCDLQE